MPTLHSGTTFPAFPRGGGEMGERMHAFDWAGARATDRFLLKPSSIDQLDAMLRAAG